MSAHAATTNEGPHYESVTEPLVNMINKAEDAIAAEFESLKATISGITKSTWRAVKNAMRWGKDKVTKAWRALGFGGKATHDTGHGAHAAAAHAPAAGGPACRSQRHARQCRCRPWRWRARSAGH